MSDTKHTPGPQRIDDAYLGDGVYASFDGYQVWIDVREQSVLSRIYVGDGQGGKKPTAGIALEPNVLVALNAYAARCRKAKGG